jgi:hypothetical protein
LVGHVGCIRGGVAKWLATPLVAVNTNMKRIFRKEAIIKQITRKIGSLRWAKSV